MILRNLTLKQFQKQAQALARKYQGQPLSIGLIGPLGAGKTTFVKTFAKTLGGRRITSPTFVINHEHKIAQGKLFHLDFYRVSHNKHLPLLGLDEILNGQNTVLIEWVDKFPALVQACDLLIKIQINQDFTRNVSIERQNFRKN